MTETIPHSQITPHPHNATPKKQRLHESIKLAPCNETSNVPLVQRFYINPTPTLLRLLI